MRTIINPTGPVASGLGATRQRVAFALVLVVLIVWFAPLGLRHLLPSDEGRYAEIAREMWSSGDWITIRYNDLKYFEKPPFQLWMTAIAYALFGIGEWQARAWVALSGIVGIVMTMVASHRWDGSRVAIYTGLVLTAAPAWIVASHFNSLDMGVSAALACVLSAVLIAQHPSTSERNQRRWMVAAWIAMAIAVLTKGLIGIVLPCLVLVVYSLIGRDRAIWRQLHAGVGLFVFLAIAEPWFVLVSMRNPEFVSFFFIHEHVTRYLSGVDHRSAPWWYFVPQLLVGFLPWLGLSAGMARVVAADTQRQGFKPSLFLAVWAAAIFVFFSLSGSKLPGYIIPVVPALAMLAGKALDRSDIVQWRRQLGVVLVCLCVAGAVLPWLAQRGVGPLAEEIPATYARLLAGLLIASAFGVGAALWSTRCSMTAGVATYAMSMLILFSGALLAHETFGRESSGIALVAPMQEVLEPGMPIYSVRLLDHTLPFYLGRTMVMVEEPGELEFGVRREPQKWIPTLDEFVRRWDGGPKALAVMTPQTYALLRTRDVAMVPIAANARRVVVSNFVRTPR